MYTLARVADALRGRRYIQGPPMVVCGAGVNGLAYARSLGRRGIPVALLDASEQPGLHSRFACAAWLPHPEREPGPCLDALLELGASLGDRPVLVATADLFLAFVARHRAALDLHYRVLAPDSATLTEMLNKKQQYTRARASGIPLPETHFPSSSIELEQALATLTFPCVIKPYAAHEGRQRIGGRKLVAVASPADARAVYAELGFDAPFMIQETVPGADDQLVGYLTLWHQGQELAAMTKRKLRQSPPHFGDGSHQVIERNETVTALARRLLSAFDYHGLAGVEFKRDARDGEYRLMEINARTVSCTQLAVSGGVDLPWLAYRMVTEGPAAIGPQACREGLTYVHEIWDVKAFRALHREGAISAAAWWRTYRTAGVLALGAWDDPMPLMHALWHSAGKATRHGRAAAVDVR